MVRQKVERKFNYVVQSSRLTFVISYYFSNCFLSNLTTRWRSWLRVRFPIVSLEFFIDIILPAALWPLGVDSASNRNEYQECFLGGKGGRFVGLTTLPPSCADCLEIWEPQPPGTLRACPGLLYLHITGMSNRFIKFTSETISFSCLIKI